MLLSKDRLLVSHSGSLARPRALLDLMQAKESGQSYDEVLYERRIQEAVTDVVQRQVEAGIDIVDDGEQSKPQCFNYITHRLSGFEARIPSGSRPGQPSPAERHVKEHEDFPEYYAYYYKTAYYQTSIVPPPPMVCTGPITYTGRGELQKDIDNLKKAVTGQPIAAMFMPATAPRVSQPNEFYKTQEEYEQAIADAMREEYLAIVNAGIMVQVDAPNMLKPDPSSSQEGAGRQIGKRIELLNYALKGVPSDMVRYHVCFGPNMGPKVHDQNLADVAEAMLSINAGYYSFEASNARHYHEYHVWENVRLPEGKVLLPGMASHGSNVVEHPEYIAELLVKYAQRIGRENLIVSNDCGFSATAVYSPEIHPSIAWAKFKAMAEGARLASARLWQG